MSTKDKETQEFLTTEWQMREVVPDGRCFTVDIIAQSHRSKLDIMPAQVNGYTEEETTATAQRLIVCWNSHDELVEALQALWRAGTGVSVEEFDKASVDAAVVLGKLTAQTQEDKK